jgi:hypothetical protein
MSTPATEYRNGRTSPGPRLSGMSTRSNGGSTEPRYTVASISDKDYSLEEPYESESLMYGCASRKGWCVQQESVLPG